MLTWKDMPSSNSCGSLGRSITSTPTSPSPTANSTYSPSCVVLNPILTGGSSRYGFPLDATPNFGCSDGETMPASRRYQVGNSRAASERMASSGCRNLRTRSCAASGRWWRRRSNVYGSATASSLHTLTSSGISDGTLSAMSRTMAGEMCFSDRSRTEMTEISQLLS